MGLVIRSWELKCLGFAVRVILDGCRGIDLEPGDVDQALDEMQQADVTFVQSSELVVETADSGRET